jgi:hypothetical protein
VDNRRPGIMTKRLSSPERAKHRIRGCLPLCHVSPFQGSMSVGRSFPGRQSPPVDGLLCPGLVCFTPPVWPILGKSLRNYEQCTSDSQVYSPHFSQRSAVQRMLLMCGCGAAPASCPIRPARWRPWLPLGGAFGFAVFGGGGAVGDFFYGAVLGFAFVEVADAAILVIAFVEEPVHG